MSTSVQVIEVLKNHGFTTPGGVDAHASSLNESQCARILDDISTLYGRNPAHLLADCRATDEEVSLFPEVHDADTLDVANLTTLCFYADRVTVPNPLIFINPDINKRIRSRPDAQAQKQRFIEAVQSVLQVEPLIQAGYVRLFPREVWTDTQPYLRFHSYNKDDVLNDPLQGYARKHIEVKSSRMGPEMQIITDMEAKEHPSRVISLFFDDNSPSDFHFFTEPAFTEYEPQSDGSVKFATLLDTARTNDSIKRDSYLSWKNGCIQRSILARADLCFEHLFYSQNFNSSFVAKYPSSWDILRLAFDNDVISKPARPRDSAVGAALLELNLPYLSSLAPKDLVSLRSQSGQFEAFRRAFRDFERDLRSHPGTREWKSEVNQMQKDRLESPLASLTKEQKRVRERFFVNALYVVGSLAIAAQTRNLGFLASALGFAGPLVTASRDKETVAKNAVYFLWQAQRQAKRRK